LRRRRVGPDEVDQLAFTTVELHAVLSRLRLALRPGGAQAPRVLCNIVAKGQDVGVVGKSDC